MGPAQAVCPRWKTREADIDGLEDPFAGLELELFEMERRLGLCLAGVGNAQTSDDGMSNMHPKVPHFRWRSLINIVC
jgi:hypothetical protein